MEANQSKLSLSLILLLSSSWVMAGFSQELGGNRPNVPMDCLEKLLPCESYLKPPASPPPSCCIPLKQMIKDDLNCLCSVFNDVDLLKSLNVSQSDLLEHPKACGANIDISVCSKGSGSNFSDFSFL
uniref:Bifunctional inhibitor/plant lipid transfer protein/seed storage helical domain-containing protein n=1 Tax=Nelumbo nucifera TaxID=4432 RepID=A0A822YTB6_NELNU|nr:TPA_asm: hypothetical protein HUJ06_006380 [Nelumbo nucifera]